MTRDAGVVTWDGLTAEALALRCSVPQVALFAETDSTLDVAHRLAERGVPTGTLVVAETQRAGRGRQGRSWSSPAGSGVWCTVIERPPSANALDLLSLRVGLHLARGLDPFARETVRVKWPNDLVVSAGKLGGTLTEARWSGQTVAWVAIGVGVNVRAPRDVQGAAALPLGTRRVDVLETIVRAVRAAAADVGELTADELRRYAARDALAGRRVVSPGVGDVAGIFPDGALLIETARGRERFRAGTVRFAEDS